MLFRSDDAQSVNAALTRVFRLVAEGRLSTRHASTLGYVAQLIIATLPSLEREAAAQPVHPLFRSDPDAILVELAQTLKRGVAPAAAPRPAAAPAPASEDGPPADRRAGQPASDGVAPPDEAAPPGEPDAEGS